ncbi:hypothetical protein [Effusibacillus pohliae]|uniref:hypothetical protein n=1 Tax=Effusibacillus pohliae TaxID=232270 RepID=UPI00036CB66B|nr:hypothetical protein [Effusibacillus pohliae]
MPDEIVIFRNVAGDVSRDDFVRWKRMIHKLGLMVEEKMRGKMMAVSLLQNEETVTFYVYEQATYYQLHIDYMRIKKGDGRLVQAIEWLIETARLRGEKFGTSRNELWRTLYVNGLIMDEGPFIERKLPSDFDLRLTREALMGHIYLMIDKYMEARTSGDRLKEEEYRKVLQGFVQELAKVDEVLKSQNRS